MLTMNNLIKRSHYLTTATVSQLEIFSIDQGAYSSSIVVRIFPDF